MREASTQIPSDHVEPQDCDGRGVAGLGMKTGVVWCANAVTVTEGIQMPCLDTLLGEGGGVMGWREGRGCIHLLVVLSLSCSSISSVASVPRARWSSFCPFSADKCRSP